VHLLRATDEAHGSHAVAPAVERILGGRDHLGMIGEAEVVVGAEIENLSRGNGDVRTLRRLDNALGLPQARLADLFELGDQVGSH